MRKNHATFVINNHIEPSKQFQAVNMIYIISREDHHQQVNQPVTTTSLP